MEKVLTVPMQAVVGGADMGPKRKVFVMVNGSRWSGRWNSAAFNDKKVEVKKGLSEGDVVVLNPKVILGDKAKGTREEGDPSGRGAAKGMPGGMGNGMKGKGGATGSGTKGGAPGANGGQRTGGGGGTPGGGGARPAQ